MPSTPHPLTDARAQLAEAIQFLGFFAMLALTRVLGRAATP